MASHAAEVFGGCGVWRPSQPVLWGIGQIVGDPGRIARLRGVAVGLYSGWKRAEVEGGGERIAKMAACREFLGCMFFVHVGCAQKTGSGEFAGLREKCAGRGLC